MSLSWKGQSSEDYCFECLVKHYSAVVRYLEEAWDFLSRGDVGPAKSKVRRAIMEIVGSEDDLGTTTTNPSVQKALDDIRIHQRALRKWIWAKGLHVSPTLEGLKEAIGKAKGLLEKVYAYYEKLPLREKAIWELERTTVPKNPNPSPEKGDINEGVSSKMVDFEPIGKSLMYGAGGAVVGGTVAIGLKSLDEYLGLSTEPIYKRTKTWVELIGGLGLIIGSAFVTSEATKSIMLTTGVVFLGDLIMDVYRSSKGYYDPVEPMQPAETKPRVVVTKKAISERPQMVVVV